MYHHTHAVDTERRKWQDPEAVLREIGVKSGMAFVDLGCGGGFFTLPAARIVGKSGTVYALDIDASSIAELKELADKEGLSNIRLTTDKAEDTVLCEKCADIVFLGTVLHDFEDPLKVLKNARKMLKPAGRLVNLDWKNEPMNIGPPLRRRFSPEKAIGLIKAAGFVLEAERDSGLYHYMIIAKPG